MKNKKFFISLAVAAFVFAGGVAGWLLSAEGFESRTSEVSASSAGMFLELDGVEGEATDKAHEGWIDISSFSHGAHRTQPEHQGQTNRGGEIVLEDMEIKKDVDKSSPAIAEAVVTGKEFPTARIHVTKPSDSDTGRITYYAYEIKNARVTSYSITGSSTRTPTEEFTLNFEEIKAVYTEIDSSGAPKSTTEYTWKVEEGNTGGRR